MSAFVVWIAAVLAFALLWWIFRRRSAPARTAQRATHPAELTSRTPSADLALRARTGSTEGAIPSSVAANWQPPAPSAPPAELTELDWLRASNLDAARRDQLLQAIRGIPRPPRSLQQLLSPEFVAKADSGQLAELVMAEPLIAAKVLGAVNSSRYGLDKPIAHLGQAVTFLGMNTVRSICLQYMLAEAFKPGLASAQQAFDAIWRWCGTASELAVRLGKGMSLPNQGALSTQVVLGFVGQLAVASLMPPKALAAWMAADRIGRTRMEQETLGLSAGELGPMLLSTWALPPDLVDDVGETARVLVTPARQADTTRAPWLGLASLCHHLGEHPEDGHIGVCSGLAERLSAQAQTFHLASYLAHPALARLPAVLASHDVQSCLSPASADEAGN